ncbi:Dihydrofolate reductase type 3 [Pirellulimonas nuda]|uniref:Dihydrofolate reductase n=1 Tax=Pirellulimonas nuda TaxID=2528009 RepID=A0A518D6R9_9BACT|nr:dihydrofolate reductase [Pirellulimonas nuda]QDU87177.1 Dihydrofolate reductase type 3 [Pirellulimonas nuda]
MTQISLIAAVAENGVIGRGGELPWRLSSDLRRFKRLTMGRCLIMGRKTYDSIGRPLPGRVSLVLTRSPGASEVEGLSYVDSLDAALARLPQTGMKTDEAFVIGGAEVYRLALPRADRIYLTRVHAEVEGDALFPEVDWDAWELVESEPQDAGPKDEFACTHEVYEPHVSGK